jgi:hypothetical protein
MWANALRAFQLGKARAGNGSPSTWMRASRMASAQARWPACHLTNASTSVVMERSSSTYYWKSTHLPELRDDLIDVLASHAFAFSSRRSCVAMFHVKGAVSRVADGATAFGNRQASHAVLRRPRPVPVGRVRQLPRRQRRPPVASATLSVTRNEILYSLNKPEGFILAIVSRISA